MKIKRADAIKAWHWLWHDRRLGYDDGTLVEAGYVYSVKGPVKLCGWGLHGSIRALNALRYASYPIVSRVLLYGTVVAGPDKLVATHREVLWIADAKEVLHDFARWCARDLLLMWPKTVPDKVRAFLDTGDPALRELAYEAISLAPYDVVGGDTLVYNDHPAYTVARAATYTDPVSAAYFASKYSADIYHSDLDDRLYKLGKRTTPNYEE